MRNALEAMEEADRREFSLRRKAGDRMIAISVTDTGSGIAPEVQSSCFSPL